METKPTLYLIRGVSGAGKSSLAATLKGLSIWTLHFEADMFFIDKDGNYNFDATKLQEAHNWCQTGVLYAMLDGVEIIVSNTFTTEKELVPYLELAEEHNYRVVSLIVENRHGGKSVHDVPEAILEKQRNRFSVKL
jgi:predicted ABC-type ATPase